MHAQIRKGKKKKKKKKKKKRKRMYLNLGLIKQYRASSISVLLILKLLNEEKTRAQS